MGTALIGSVLIATLSTVASTGVAGSPAVSDSFKSQIFTELVGGVPFVSDAQLTAGLAKAGVGQPEIDSITAINADARLKALQVAFRPRRSDRHRCTVPDLPDSDRAAGSGCPDRGQGA